MTEHVLDYPVAADRVAEFRACFASEASFRRFYDRALPRLYGYLFHRCRGDAALAEDLAQVAFAEVLRQRDAYEAGPTRSRGSSGSPATSSWTTSGPRSARSGGG